MAEKHPSRIRVLVSGPLPPPVGGMTAFYQSLLNSSLPNRVNFRFVRTSSQRRELSNSGRISVSNLLAAIIDCGRFASATLKHRPQVAHIATAYGLSFIKHSICVGIARGLGSRVLLHPHCSFSVLYTERSKLWQWLFRQVIRLTDGIIALSKEWEQVNAVDSTCRIYSIPNAIDLNFYRDIARKRLEKTCEEGRLNILYLGYLGRAKGSFDVIDAAREIQSQGIDIIFNLVGDELSPGEQEHLQEQINTYKIHKLVRVFPPAFDSEKLTFFRNADVFIYPSYHEGMPIAVLEAMACGLPIVATRVGGLPDLINEGVNGILMDPGKPDQLAAALNKLFADKELRYSMQQRSYQLVSEQYDIEKRVSQLVEIYKSVSSNGKLGAKVEKSI